MSRCARCHGTSARARATIDRIVLDAESRFDEERYWPLHPLDRQDGATKHFETALYDGACGVFWALHYLEAVGAATLSRSYAAEWDRLLPRNRAGSTSPRTEGGPRSCWATLRFA